MLDVTKPHGVTAIKITAFIRPQLLVKLSNLDYKLRKTLSKNDNNANTARTSIFEYIKGEYR